MLQYLNAYMVYHGIFKCYASSRGELQKHYLVRTSYNLHIMSSLDVCLSTSSRLPCLNAKLTKSAKRRMPF